MILQASVVEAEAAPPSTKLRVGQLEEPVAHLVQRFEATQGKKRLTPSDLIKNVSNPQSRCNTDLQHQFLTQNTLERIEKRLKATLASEIESCKETCFDLRKDIEAIRENRER